MVGGNCVHEPSVAGCGHVTKVLLNSCNKTASIVTWSPPRFAERLKQLRDVAGLTLRDLAGELGTTASTLSRWEREETTPKREDVVKIDGILAAQGALLRLWTSQTSGSSLPPWMQDAAKLMAEAVSIECFSPVLVPGMLQCQEYAEMVFRYGQPLEKPEEIRRLAQVRGGRYEKLQQGRDPIVSAVVPMAAFTRVPEPIRKAQANHLCKIMDTGRVTLCLVPEDALLVGITSPLVLLRLSDGGRAGTTDHVSGNFLLDESTDWARLDEVTRQAYAVALPSHQSRNMLGELR
ncbi:helix-turn-helix domain-containing protein [Haloactinospora alba]|uniref:helix-turn-helix domain-containing protein n=1 Tax=Haloactinospora alba TaxID=405555 RepID=UPI0037444C96